MLVPETNAGIELGLLELFSSGAAASTDVVVVAGVAGFGCFSLEAVCVSGEGVSTGGGGKSTKSTPISVCGEGGTGFGACVDGVSDVAGNVDDCGGAGVGGIQPSWRATPSKSARCSSGDGAAVGGATPSDPSGTMFRNVSRLKSGGAACC